MCSLSVAPKTISNIHPEVEMWVTKGWTQHLSLESLYSYDHRSNLLKKLEMSYPIFAGSHVIPHHKLNYHRCTNSTMYSFKGLSESKCLPYAFIPTSGQILPFFWYGPHLQPRCIWLLKANTPFPLLLLSGPNPREEVGRKQCPGSLWIQSQPESHSWRRQGE